MNLHARTVRHLSLPGLIVLGLADLAHAQPVEARAPLDDRELHRAILVAEDRRAFYGADLDLLTASLHHTSPEVQQVAVRALGRLEKPTLVPVIARVLDADSPSVRSEAANALAQSVASGTASDEDVQAVERALRERLNREADPGVTGVLLSSLGRLPYKSVLEVVRAEAQLRAALSDAGTSASGHLRLGAARGLDSLVRLRVKASPPMSSETALVLRQTVHQGAASLPGSAVVRRLAINALLNGGTADRATLEAAGRDPDVQVRRLAALGAGLIDALDSRAPLIDRGLRDSSPMVRYQALRAYGQRLLTNGCGPIRSAVSDKNLHVALAALDLLGEPCTDRAASHELLARAVQDSEWHHAAHAFVALARQFPDTARPLMDKFAGHDVWQVRMYAARAAATLGDGPRLEQLASDPHDNVREAAVEGLRRVRGHEAAEVYLSALGRSDYQLLLTAATAIEGGAPRDQTVRTLLAAIDRVTGDGRFTSRDTRVKLLKRLGELGTAEHAARIEPYLADFDPVVASQAARVLERWTGRAYSTAPYRPVSVVPSAAELEGLELLRAVVSMRSGGTFELALFSRDTPLTVSRFVRLARSGYYNGLTFHRVVPNFVIQGGSPGANEYMGDADFLRDEVGLRSHGRGTLGISTRGRDTGDAQIFINLVDNPRLDHTYTVFAEVAQGMDVVDRILEGDVIERIEIVSGPRVSSTPTRRQPIAKRTVSRD